MEAAHEINFSEVLTTLSMKLNADEEKSERILADMLHVLRDNLPYEKAILLYKVLPDSLRPIYTKGWNSTDIEKPARKFCEFREQFMKCEEELLAQDRKGRSEVKRFLIGVLQVLCEILPVDKLWKVLQALPDDMREIIRKAVFSDLPKKPYLS